jgi:hypothetical protein
MLAIPPLIPLIHRDLHLDEKAVGALLALPVLLLALASVPGSLLIAKLGVRWALVAGLGFIAGLVLIRQRPGSAKGVVFITLEDETGVANLVVWPDVFDKQRKIVMGARLMAIHGIVQSEEGVIHVVARRLEDHSHMLRQLSDDMIDAPLSRGDAPGAIRPPPGRHPRDVEVIPKSRDFH